MSAPAAGPSKYDIIQIEKNGETIDLKGGTLSVDYYESLYSPSVTARVLYMDAGGNIEDKKSSKLVSVKEGLPIEGLEDVKLKISPTRGKVIDFTKDPFKVDAFPTLSKEANRETVVLSLVSPKQIINDETPVFDKYKGKISDTVKKILKEKFKITNDKIKIDKTKNDYNFLGKGRGGLNLIIDLCKRSVPEGKDADPGYFFFQTKSGFKFKSIDSMLDDKPKFTFNYFGGFRKDNTKDDNDNKLVREPIFQKDQNISNTLKNGVYRSRNIFFDPRTFSYEEINYDISKDGVSTTLGKAPPFAKDVNGFTKTFHHILDVGSLDSNVSTKVNNDPRLWQAKSVMRYNLLHSQIVNIQVPCNTEIEAGDIIKLEIESISDNKEENPYDEQQSGKYLVLHLCHHFDSKRSFTSMTLVRDTYGRRGSKK